MERLKEQRMIVSVEEENDIRKWREGARKEGEKGRREGWREGWRKN